MTDVVREQTSEAVPVKEPFLPTSRRTFFKTVASVGAAASLVSKGAWAQEIGFWAKDLPNDKLIQMYTDYRAHPLA